MVYLKKLPLDGVGCLSYNDRIVNEQYVGKITNKQLWNNWIYCSGIFLEGLRRTTKNFGQGNRSACQD
jgi:hypothetical protein